MSGLEGSGLILRNNGGDDLPVMMDGDFIFDTALEDESSYDVRVSTEPSSPNQMCTINGGMGELAGADVTSISIVCSTDVHTVSGTATGVTSEVTISNNGGDEVTISEDGTFSFAVPVVDGAMYEVVVSDTTGQYCTVENGSGTISGADVTNVTLSCGPVPAVVEALYPVNGADWNDYVGREQNDRLHARDISCAPSLITRYDDCVHGGEMRAVEVFGKSSCEGLTITEELGLFNWVCDDSTNPVRMVSDGLQNGVQLSELLDFDQAQWRPNSVSVSDGGVEHFTTTSEAWWDNPVVDDNDGGLLDQEGTIYIVTNASLGMPTGGYVIGASAIALVSQPGTTISGPGGGSSSKVIETDPDTTVGFRFLWLEVSVDASVDGGGLRLRATSHSRLDRIRVIGTVLDFTTIAVSLGLSSSRIDGLTVRGSDSGAFSLVGARNDVLNLRAENNAAGGVSVSGDDNVIDNITVENGGGGVSLSGEGVVASRLASHLNGSAGVNVHFTRSSLVEVSASNNDGHGLNLVGVEDSFFGAMTITNNRRDGIWIEDSPHQVFHHATIANNGGSGIDIRADSPGTSLLGIITANNGVFGLNIQAGDATISGIAATDNLNFGIRVGADNNRFTGALVVGNVSSDCYVPSTLSSPGMDDDNNPADVMSDAVHDGLCIEQGSSDFGTATTMSSIGSSIVGRTYTDAANGSATGAALPFPGGLGAFDGSTFEHPFRTWGPDNALGASSRAPWASGDGAIWDWALLAADTLLLDQFAAVDSTDVFSHTLSSGNNTTFLENAIEIIGDGVGNDDGLCRFDEECLYTPNLGSYPGHGDIVHVANIAMAGTLTDIVLRRYADNGR